MIDFLFIVFIAALIISFFVLMYTHTDLFFDFNKKLKKENETLFNIVGSDGESLDDKKKWMKHYRIFLILFAVLIFPILIMYVFDF